MTDLRDIRLVIAAMSTATKVSNETNNCLHTPYRSKFTVAWHLSVSLQQHGFLVVAGADLVCYRLTVRLCSIKLKRRSREQHIYVKETGTVPGRTDPSDRISLTDL